MLSQINKENILSKFPNVKLSYENITHKKVFESDYIVAVPEGKKCFIWFTNVNDEKTCLVMELSINKQINNIKKFSACFSDELSYGTIFYGTLFNQSYNNFFSIEDIFSYKGNDLEKICWGEKLTIILNIMENDLKQISYNNYFVVFGLPLIAKTNEEIEKKIKTITYKIHSIQFKFFNKTNNFLFMNYKDYISSNLIQPTKNNINSNFKQTYQNIKREIVFNIRPDIQDDIYHIYSLNNELKEENHGIAHIPDYNTSVMMNKLFRIIKENYNLDALEESDNEEEFQNENIDKFVYLDKSFKIVCQFNQKFKKWVPLKLANNTDEIITNKELQNIYNFYQQNNKK